LLLSLWLDVGTCSGRHIAKNFFTSLSTITTLLPNGKIH